MSEAATGEFIVRDWRPEDRDAVISLHKELQAYEIALRTSRSKKDEVSTEYVKELEEELCHPESEAAFFF